MKDVKFELAKKEIKDTLPQLIIGNALNKRGFTPSNGGEFSCPCCGKTLKAYRNNHTEWAINPLGHCSDFGAVYSCDAFGLVSALTGEDEKKAFKRLMSEKGIVFSGKAENHSVGVFSASEIKTEYEKALSERNKRIQDEQKARNAIKMDNAVHLMEAASFGFDMPDNAVDLLYKRCIDVLALPSPVVSCIGYVKAAGFKCLDKDSTYSIEGIVFKLNENGAQVRRTKDDAFIGKESKMARFQTFGDAKPFLMPYAIGKNNGAPLFICEGPFDALSLYQTGAVAVIGALGAGNHSYILDQFQNWKGPVFVCFDTDNTGKDCGSKLVREFKRQNQNAYILKLSGQEHDINDNLQTNPTALYNRIKIVSILSEMKNYKKLENACKMISSADFTQDYRWIDSLLFELQIEQKFNKMK